MQLTKVSNIKQRMNYNYDVHLSKRYVYYVGNLSQFTKIMEGKYSAELPIHSYF